MDFSTENIFKYHGQYDKVVTLSFNPDSYSAKNYGQFITGIFQYTRDERIALESTISNQGYENHHGHVKLKELLDDVCDEQKEELIRKGIDTTDIIEVFSANITIPKNEFQETDQRSLPAPVIIETDFSNYDYDPIAMGMYKSKDRNGYKLTPYEECEKIGSELSHSIKSIEEIKNEEYIDPASGKVKSGILLHILHSRRRRQVLNKEEEQVFQELEIQDLSYKIILLRKTLLEYVQKKDIANDETQSILNHIVPKVIPFHIKRLTQNKIPAWIDLERYLHIYFHHVKEVQIGSNKEKSAFKYDFNEIDMLMDIVLSSIQVEIQKHFEENSDKPYKRHGTMSYYFKGDYYVIHIEPDGRLMTFYKVK